MARWDPAGDRRWPGQSASSRTCVECRESFTAVATHAELCSNRCTQRRRRRRIKEESNREA